MKNNFCKWILLGVIALGVIMGCNDKPEDEPGASITVVNEETLNQTVEADATAGSSEVRFTTTEAWTSTVSANWLKITPTSGDAGTHAINIELTPNTAGNDRTGTIMLKCGTQEVKINVTQKGVEALGRKVTFVVYGCNEQWMPGSEVEPHIISPQVRVTVFKDGIEVASTLTNTNNGIAEMTLEDGNYTYVATDEAVLSNISREGYVLNGLRTTLTAETEFLKTDTAFYLYADLNGDGIVNDQDKAEQAPMTVDGTTDVDVFVAKTGEMPAGTEFFNAISNIYSLYIKLMAQVYQVDAALTHEATDFNQSGNPFRELYYYQFNAQTAAIADLWDFAYQTVVCADRVLFYMDAEYDVPEHVKDISKMGVLLYRAHAYYILTNYFGDVPLNVDNLGWPVMGQRIAKSDVEQVIISECEDIIDIARADSIRVAHEAMMLRARVMMNRGEYEPAMATTDEIIMSGRYALSPNPEAINADAISLKLNNELLPEFMRKGDGMYPVRYIETYLLNIEAQLAMNTANMTALLDRLNQLLVMQGLEVIMPGADVATIKEAGRKLWTAHLNREGHAFAGLKRTGLFPGELGEYGAKDYHQYLPVPQRAMAENSELVQNQGY